MIDPLRYAFNPNNFEPRATQLDNTPILLWIFILSNLVVFVSYTLIPVALLYYERKRRDLDFSWIFLWFVGVILLGGLHYFLQVISFWYPLYGLAALNDVITAIVSLITLLALLKVIPVALNMPTPRQLRAANDELQTEIEKRRKVEEELRQKHQDLVKHQTVLSEKNAELEQTNRILVAREQKINELKKEIQNIRNQGGQ